MIQRIFPIFNNSLQESIENHNNNVQRLILKNINKSKQIQCELRNPPKT